MSTGVYYAPQPRITAVSLRADVSSAVWSFAACAMFTAGCLLYSAEFHHWFILPVLICGGLIGIDAINWLRSRMDVFDPVGHIGLLGVHFFFTAPLLHVGTQYWMGYIVPPEDWRPWLGYMGCLNVAGLVIYRVMRRLLERSLPAPRMRTLWQFEPQRFVPLLLITLVVTAVLQTAVYSLYGGIAGYITAYTETSQNFTGMGIVFMFSEAFPTLFIFGAVYWAVQRPGRRTLTLAIAMLVAFVALKLYFGGLRGSRGLVIYGLYWAVGIIHLVMLPLPKRVFYAGAVFLVTFMYAYGFYKSFGADSVQALEGSRARADLLETSSRTMDVVLLGDMARADVQAFEIYRLSLDWRDSQFNYFWGETYLGALSLVVPRSLVQLPFARKVKAGTDLLFGLGVFENEVIGSNAYGLAGEAMLNFGPAGALLSFVILALVVDYARRWFVCLPRNDARCYLLPFGLSLTFMMVLWDADVVVFYTVKEGFLPTLLLVMSVKRFRCVPSSEMVTA